MWGPRLLRTILPRPHGHRIPPLCTSFLGRVSPSQLYPEAGLFYRGARGPQCQLLRAKRGHWLCSGSSGAEPTALTQARRHLGRPSGRSAPRVTPQAAPTLPMMPRSRREGCSAGGSRQGAVQRGGVGGAVAVVTRARGPPPAAAAIGRAGARGAVASGRAR